MAAMNKIDEKLFLGNIKSASDLKQLKSQVLKLKITNNPFHQHPFLTFLLIILGNNACLAGRRWDQAILPECKYSNHLLLLVYM